MPHLSIALLGPLTVTLDGAPVTNFDYAKVRALLVYLAVEHTRPHPRDVLAELLWPDQPPHAGRNSLRQALATLRKALHDSAAQPPFLLISRESIQFNTQSDHTLDISVFADLLAACERHQHEPDTCRTCAGRWEHASRLYRGSFGTSAVPPASQDFEEWVTIKREWFEQQELVVLAKLAAYHERRGDWASALQAAQRSLTIDLWQEEPHRRAMRLLAALGQQAAALAQYEQCRRMLAAELGTEPEPETVALYERIRAGEGGEPREGEPATKPARQEETSLADSSIPPAPTPNLPVPHARLIGRTAELGELAAMLRDLECRLITLLGPGGIGKTRLALRAAEIAAEHFRDGVRWVALGTIASPEYLAETIARAVDPALAEAQAPRAALLAFLRPRKMLLVLDNIEHLLERVDLLVELLLHAPDLTLLVTSRERLRLQREWIYQVSGLPFPHTEDDPADYAAVQLLLSRARQVRRVDRLSEEEQRAVRRITRLVEGTPLALELAAAASHEHSFSRVADGIAESIDMLAVSYHDVSERHRSIRAALDYSWRRLNNKERAALARLSVFRGGFDPAAARQVAQTGARMLEGFAGKSLLRHQNGRYEVHELVRQFTNEQLMRLGEAEQTHEAHLSYIVALAEEAEPQLLGAEQELWLPRLELEQANIRAALTWSLGAEVSSAETTALREPRRIPATFQAQGARIAGALWRFWWMRSYVSEGRRWLDRAVAALQADQALAPQRESHSPENRQRMALLAKVAKGAGNLANEQSDYERAHTCYALGIMIEEALGNQRGMANNMSNLALVAINQGNFAEARALLERSMAIFEEIGHERGVAIARDGLAEVAFSEGDYTGAQALYERSLAQHMARGDLHSAAIARHNLNDIARAQGSYGVAAAGARENLALFRELGNDHGVAASLHILGAVAYAQGHWEDAREYHAEALLLAQRGGNRLSVVSGLVGLMVLAGARGEWNRVARLCGAIEAARLALQSTLAPADFKNYQQTIASAQAALGDQRWQAEWDYGQKLSLDDAIAL